MQPYRALRPALFRLPPEVAHGLGMRFLSTLDSLGLSGVLSSRFTVWDDRLETTAFGVDFPNPVGLAAGFDKNATAMRPLAALGFGHVEVGAVTAHAQPGNPRPRLFRLPEDDALINRMGFNNDGADVVGARLEQADAPGVPLGVNIGKSKVTPLEDAAEDYAYTYERVAEHADFFVVNVSSPNTPGLRELQGRDHLESIVSRLLDLGASPLLVKLSPDLADPAVVDALELVDDLDLDGVIATNTTTDRPSDLRGQDRDETGGLSGRPIEDRATDLVGFVHERTDVPVVGVGGVFTAEDAYRKIRAGASLVQLYTGLVYRGPGIARDVNTGLLSLLERDGFDSVADAVGTA